MALYTMLMVFLLGCLPAAGEDACPPGAEAEACLGVGPPRAEAAGEALESVTGAPIALCSADPLTGYYRDGRCRTGADDRGVHVVCAVLTDDFLDYTAQHGNDLTTPRPQLGFPGLRPNDRWCLCAARWEEARQAGVAPPVVLEATHAAALQHTRPQDLQDYALRTP